MEVVLGQFGFCLLDERRAPRAQPAITGLLLRFQAYLLEEPDNGIHPMAIEYTYLVPLAVRVAQVFIATHSPTLLRNVEFGQVLCFGHDPGKGTVIVSGDKHPRLREWQGSADNTIFWVADILS